MALYKLNSIFLGQNSKRVYTLQDITRIDVNEPDKAPLSQSEVSSLRRTSTV